MNIKTIKSGNIYIYSFFCKRIRIQTDVFIKKLVNNILYVHIIEFMRKHI